MAPGLQKSLQGAPFTLPIMNLDGFGLLGNGNGPARSAALGAMYQATTEPLKSIGYNTLQTISLLDTIDFAGYTPGAGAVYPTTMTGTALKSVAALIKAQVGVEAIAIDVATWDHHNSQGVMAGSFNSMLIDLANCLAAFYADMMAVATNPTFTLVAMSEFGRRLAENGSRGTDHGFANMMMVMGNCVKGGRVLANWPGLNAENLFQGQDLAVTIDYRDVLAEIVQRRLGNNELGYVFPGFVPVDRNITRC